VFSGYSTLSALTGIRAAIHRTITGKPISRSINILKDVEFTQANKMFEFVCKSYYKRGNPKPQHKNPIEPGDNGEIELVGFEMTVQTSPKNLCGSTFVISCGGEEGNFGANLLRTRLSLSTTTIETKSISL